jgi:hypothetical protein
MFELQARKRASKKQLRERFEVAVLFAILVLKVQRTEVLQERCSDQLL